MLPNICTTIEQSNRILACGIDKNTADMYMDENGVIHIGWFSNISTEEQHQYTPLWSFNALVSLFPCNLYELSLTANKRTLMNK